MRRVTVVKVGYRSTNYGVVSVGNFRLLVDPGMPRRLWPCSAFIAGFLLAMGPAMIQAQKSSGPTRGSLIIDGGGVTKSVVARFVELAGGPRARVVVFPTAASSIVFGAHNTIVDPDWPRNRAEWGAYEAYLKEWFGVDDVVVLHTRDRAEADSAEFTVPLRAAAGAGGSSQPRWCHFGQLRRGDHSGFVHGAWPAG